MKKLIFAVSLLVALVGQSRAMTAALTTPIYSGPISSTQTINVDMNAARVDFMSVTAAYSSDTLVSASFIDGSKSTGTITPKTVTAFSALASSDTLTISTNSALVATQGSLTVTISSNGAIGAGGANILTGSTITVNGYQLTPGNQWTIGASSNSTAVSLAAAFNNVSGITATGPTNGGATITLTCTIGGAFCNSYRITTSTVAVTFSTTGVSNLFTGGNDNPSFTISDPARVIVFSQGTQWFQNTYSSNTAISVVNAINAYGNFLTASTTTATIVTIQAVKKSLTGNQFALTSSTPALTVGSGNFIGGQNAASFTLQGITKTAGIDWAVGTSSVTASTAIVSAINSDPYLSTIVIATTSITCPGCGIVYATSTVLGVNAWNLISSSTSTLLVGGFSGGGASAVTTANSSLVLPSHGFATGTQVYLATTTATSTPPGLLFIGTTYYAVVLDANDIQLSSSLANATAIPAVVVVISTQTVNGGGAFKLMPLGLTQPMLLTWNASDDNSNFNPLTLPNNVTPATITVSTSAAASSSYWDFGQINARYLQLKVQGPTSGAFNLTVTPYGKSQANGY